MIGCLIKSGSFDLEELFNMYEDNTALDYEKGNCTFNQLRELLISVLTVLNESGIKRGDNLGLYMNNSIYHVLLLLASWVAGFRLVLYNPRTPLSAQMRIVKCRVVIGNYCQNVENVEFIKPEYITNFKAGKQGFILAPGLDSESAVIFTSGSTGSPKGVVLTTGNFIFSSTGTAELLDMNETDSWLISLPMFHIGGLTIPVRTLLCGGKSIITPDTGSLDDIIIKARPSFLSLVPTQLIRMLKNQETVKVLKTCRGILLGGAPPPSWLIRDALKMNIPVIPTYGSTETCAQLTAVTPGSPECDFYTSGRPLRYRQLDIDENSRITAGGKTLFKKYIKNGEDIYPHSGSSFVTNDTGYLDYRGNLVVTGRIDQVFISGGENINPFEVEKELLKIEGIREAFVVPVPDREMGSVPWAFISSEVEINNSTLVNNLKQSLPSFKVPRRFVWLNNDDSNLKHGREDLVKLASVIAGE